MRRHVWAIWAGINEPAASGGPLWETWTPEEQVFASGPSPQDDAARAPAKFRRPRQFEDSGASPQAAGQALLSFVLFNREAKEHVRTNKLHLKSTMDAINAGFGPAVPVADRKIPDFPAASVVLKTAWWVVKSTGRTTIPVWDASTAAAPSTPQPPDDWKRAVRVDPTRVDIPTGETESVAPFGACRVVPLSDFYFVRIDSAEMLAEVVAALGASGVQSQNPALHDYVVLVGMHLTTKEIPDWVWATFWWHDAAGAGPFAAQRPSSMPRPWSSYLMDVTLDADSPTEPGGGPNVCYNPWLEARFQDGIVSNCMGCHQKALWPQGVPFGPVQRGRLPAGDPIFRDRTKTDFLWSLNFGPH